MTELTYKASGVNVAAGDDLVKEYSALAKGTATEHVVSGIGGFAGFLALPQGFSQPVLTACTDGVGTKLRLLIDAGKPETAGMDAAAMCLNDLATSGSQPLFMLDYLATGSLDAQAARSVVSGFAAYCRQAGCALLGGETAEMPGFYPPGDFDVAGFAVGVVERAKIIDGSRCRPGDVVIGLASSGVHSNGFSLLRMMLNQGVLDGERVYPGLDNSLLDEILKPTRLYLPLARDLAQMDVKAMTHITGGGLPGNAARSVPDNLDVCMDAGGWPLPPVFQAIAKAGVKEAEMLATFNMGIGFTAVVEPDLAAGVISCCGDHGVEAWPVGKLTAGSGKVRIDEV